MEELVTVYPNIDDIAELLDLLQPIGRPITSSMTVGPLTGKDKIIARFQCAADYGDEQSLASKAAGGPPPNFLENLFSGEPVLRSDRPRSGHLREPHAIWK